MKLGIVIPLKSQKVSKNWDITCAALDDTIRSIENQSSGRFEAIVVGHERPPSLVSNKGRVKFHSVDFPPPDKQAPEFSHKDYIFDKNSKIVKGLQLLKNDDIKYWYALDSDDLLSCDFVEKILTLNNKAGCILEGGYLIYKARRLVVPCDNMFLYCGSTSVIANEFMDIPDELNEVSMQRVPWCRYSHINFHKFFEKEINQPYAKMKDKLLGYVLGHGDNISDGWRNNKWKAFKAYMKPFILGRHLNDKIKLEFSLVSEKT